jgi:hypothetical protein
MTDNEIQHLLRNIEIICNDAIDKLITTRQNCLDSRKQKLSYITKKLEVIVGAANRGLEKLE